MPTHVALLRGLNLGNRRIKMSELADCFRGMGFTDVATVLASGNVVFTAPPTDSTDLGQSIEDSLADQLGYQVPTVIRDAETLESVIRNTPNSELFTDQPYANTQITFFGSPITPDEAARLEGLSTPTDRLIARDRELYWRCATKISESPLWNDRKANPHNDPRGTTRNLRTLEKIVAKLRA